MKTRQAADYIGFETPTMISFACQKGVLRCTRAGTSRWEVDDEQILEIVTSGQTRQFKKALSQAHDAYKNGRTVEPYDATGTTELVPEPEKPKYSREGLSLNQLFWLAAFVDQEPSHVHCAITAQTYGYPLKRYVTDRGVTCQELRDFGVRDQQGLGYVNKVWTTYCSKGPDVVEEVFSIAQRHKIGVEEFTEHVWDALTELVALIGRQTTPGVTGSLVRELV